MIIAITLEVAQRIETKRPTVARASNWPICEVAWIPIRASDPLTEMIRPNGVAMEGGLSMGTGIVRADSPPR